MVLLIGTYYYNTFALFFELKGPVIELEWRKSKSFHRGKKKKLYSNKFLNFGDFQFNAWLYSSTLKIIDFSDANM